MSDRPALTVCNKAIKSAQLVGLAISLLEGFDSPHCLPVASPPTTEPARPLWNTNKCAAHQSFIVFTTRSWSSCSGPLKETGPAPSGLKSIFVKRGIALRVCSWKNKTIRWALTLRFRSNLSFLLRNRKAVLTLMMLWIGYYLEPDAESLQNHIWSKCKKAWEGVQPLGL